MSHAAFQKCISPSCGATYGVDESRVACDQCGHLLDVAYDWDRLSPPEKLSEFEALWSRRNEPLDEYLQRVGRSDFLWGKDNAAYTLSLQGAFEDNGQWKTYPNTHYLSYITEQTGRGLFSSRYYPDFRMNPALLATSTYMGQKEFAQPPIPVDGFKSSDW